MKRSGSPAHAAYLLPEDKKLGKQGNGELHRLLKEYRWVYTVFSQISGKARGRVKAIQSILHRRGEQTKGRGTPPENMRHPKTGPGFTDHAILRFLERAKGVNLREVEAEMTERFENGTSYFNGAVVVDRENITYVTRYDNVVVSVMPEEWLSEADKVAAEQSFRNGKNDQKDAHFRALAAEGLDTDAKKRLGRE